jgi:hypothetical protein
LAAFLALACAALALRHTLALLLLLGALLALLHVARLSSLLALAGANCALCSFLLVSLSLLAS